jgi:hypothetical protein
MQASGSATITLLQGDRRQTVVYQAGCNDAACSLPRTDTARLQLSGGCSEITIMFTDAGAENKWLHVSARKQSKECSDTPDYPSCNNLTQRRSLAMAHSQVQLMRQEEVMLLNMGITPAAPADPIVSTHGRHMLNSSEHRRIMKAWLHRDSGQDTRTAEPFYTDDEDGGRVDIDADIDASCSLFQVCHNLFCPMIHSRV